MRAVFTVELGKKQANFPSNEEIERLMDDLGRGFKNLAEMTQDRARAILTAQSRALSNGPTAIPEVSSIPQGVHQSETALESYEERREKYRELAGGLFDEMPEVASAEKAEVIYLGYFQKQQSLFILTRMNSRELTFRLLHRELPRLQASTTSMVRDLLAQRAVSTDLSSDNVEINIYERVFDYVIIKGRVITKPIRETIRSDKKDFVLFIFPLLLFLPTAFVVDHWSQLSQASSAFWHGQMERFSTALVTTSLVSALGLFTNWYEIKRSKLIDWSVKTDLRQ
jgi:hypothetical protein